MFQRGKQIVIMACDWCDVVGLAAFALACATTSAPGAKGMNPEVLQVLGFTVVGISVRTDNAKEATPAGVIGKLWARLMQENLLAKIPNRVGENIVAVYKDYASGNAGEYTFILGAKVSRIGDSRGNGCSEGADRQVRRVHVGARSGKPSST